MSYTAPEVFQDLTGRTFTNLTAVSPGGVMRNMNLGQAWLCLCRCGGFAAVTSANLLSKSVRSCGLCQPRNNTAWVEFNHKPGLIMTRAAAITLVGEPQWLIALSTANLDAGTVPVNGLDSVTRQPAVVHRKLPFHRVTLDDALAAAAARNANR